MGKIEEAIKKINAEIQKQPNNEYLALIGEHIIDCITTEDTAEEVLKTEKTLAGALREIEANAAKRKSGKVAVVEDAVVYL